ncbi:hypothetical protein QFC20_006272 [Naganishia adeliensis]|uniref:Uncharacterized protein n=1 Tax=Naganishia adeliensis TaxID=92952 RepID=A0ACC2VEN9_9TREE|nr:hypothetical protein QFC20_006272 [Naganishia adeliensis]
MASHHPSVRFSLPPSAFFDYPPAHEAASIAPPPYPYSPFTIPEDIYRTWLDIKIPLYVAVVYTIVVKSLNKYNRSRGGKPWAISKTRAFFWLVVLHNVFLAVYSAWTFVGIVSAGYGRSFIAPWKWSQGGLLATIDSMCKIQGPKGYGNATIFDSSPAVNLWLSSHPATSQLLESHPPSALTPGRLWNEGLAFYGWIFYLSKYYEILDTVIILMKGKQSSNLQSYHHAGAIISMWIGIRYMSPPIFIFVFFNSFIHALMYTYYVVTSFSIRVPKPIKQSLTTMQITQFLVGGSSAALSLFISYSYPITTASADPVTGKTHLTKEYKHVPCLDTPGQALAVVFNVVYLTPLTWLFARFFIRSYLASGSKSAAPKVRDAGKQAVNGLEKTGSAGLDVEDTSVKMNGNGVEQVVKASAANVRQQGQEATAAARKGWERSTKTAD